MAGARTEIGNLPRESTSFVGRRSEVTAAKRLLGASRLVTLTGVGGVGKTRLALQVAAATRRSFPDGTWLVDLGEQFDPQLVAGTVAASLNIRDWSAAPPLEMLTDFLRERRLLLILDGCEHLVGAVATLAETLLRLCPDVHVLVTSREPLLIGGEAVMRVPPLTVPSPGEPASAPDDAMALFAERAEASVPGFEITDDNRDAVARLCRRLEGLPLAIELAAARLRTMSVAQILEQFEKVGVLTGDGVEAPGRQRTLMASVDWSYQLCTREERAAWRRLAVFAQGFELDAAEAVTADDHAPNELLDLISSLIEKSILIRDEYDAGQGVRYRFLDMIREYGLLQLRESGEASEIHRRYRDWYQQLTQRVDTEWIGPNQAAWIARLGRERANLREVLSHWASRPSHENQGLVIANALVAFWLARGLLHEGRLWLSRLLDACPAPSAVRATALCGAAMIAANQGDIDAASAWLGGAEALATTLHDSDLDETVAETSGHLAFLSGDLDRAIELFVPLLPRVRDGTDRRRHLSVLYGLGLASALRGDTARAAESAREILEITTARGETIYNAYAPFIEGLSVAAADPTRARRLWEESLQLNASTDDIIGSALCVEGLACLAADDAEYRRAAILFGAARSLWMSVGSTGVIAPRLRAWHDELEQRSRAALGTRAFTTAIHQGVKMTLADILDYTAADTPPAPTAARSASGLTPRELEVAELVAQGMTNKAIAERLAIVPRTAQGHVENILTKLGFSSRTQIAGWVLSRSESDTG